MSKYDPLFEAHGQLKDQEAQFLAGLNGRVPTLAESRVIRGLRSAATEIAKRVTDAYEKTTASIKKVYEAVDQVVRDPKGFLSAFTALAVDLINRGREVKMKFDFPRRRMAELAA